MIYFNVIIIGFVFIRITLLHPYFSLLLFAILKAILKLDIGHRHVDIGHRHVDIGYHHVDNRDRTSSRGATSRATVPS